ncbi:hypothetical protein HY251_12570 [bacterium]|nr:hypothetical protein [bacterium]
MRVPYLALAAILAAFVSAPLALRGDEPPKKEEPKKDDASKEKEKDKEKPDEDSPKAEDLVPFEKLEVDLRKELWKVTRRYTVRRRLDEKTIHCTADTYGWLLRRLPLASVASRELELGKYVIEGKGEAKFSIDDTEGAQADCERVFEEDGRIVIVARGSVEGVLLPKTKGTGVIVCRWREDKDDKKKVATECFVFFRVASDELHALTAPFRDALGKVLGGKLDGLVGTATKIACEIEKDPDKVRRALVRSKKLKDEEIDEFRRKFLLG